jgi:hypothetical protein
VTLIETILKHSWQDDMVGPHLVRVDDALSAFRAWLEDERLVVVPAEPTPRMFEANSKCTSQELWAGIGWAAMISAAPDALETKP